MEDDSPSIGGWTMEYATRPGPLLLESPLMGMISNSKLHHTIMLWMSTHHILPTYISRTIYIPSVIKCYMYKGPNGTFPHFVRGRPNGIGRNEIKTKWECTAIQTKSLSHSLVHRPHPLTRRNGLVNQVKFLGLAHTFATL